MSPSLKEALLSSVTTLLSGFCLIIIVLGCFVSKYVLSSDLEQSSKFIGLIVVMGIISAIFITIVLFALFSRDILFDSMYAHLIRTKAKFGSSREQQWRSATRKAKVKKQIKKGEG